MRKVRPGPGRPAGVVLASRDFGRVGTLDRQRDRCAKLTVDAVWFRMRAELRSRWRSILAVALLVGLASAAVLTAAAGARRTATTVERYLEASRANDVFVQVGSPGAPEDPALFDAIERLPQVETLGRVAFPGVFPRSQEYFPFVASVDGREGTTIDRFPIIDGRRADPDAIDEAVVTESTAARLGVEPGDRLRLISFSPEQAAELEQGENDVEPGGPDLSVRVVGIARTGNDLVARPQDPVPSLLTPAFLHRYGNEILSFGRAAVVGLHGGDAAVPAFRKRVGKLVGRDTELRFESVGSLSRPIDDAVSTVAVGLWVFAAVVALAALVALGVALARQAFLGARDDETLGAMGMSRRHRFAANLVPFVGATLAGAAVGVVGAVAASPIMPVGDLARRIEPVPGIDVDPLVLVLGFGATCAIVVGLAAITFWRASGRATGTARATSRPGAPWIVASKLARAGAGPAALTGVRMALEPGRGRTAVPVRSALVGVVAGITGVVAVLTFGANLGRLTDSPARYGFGWDVDVVDPDIARLRRDPDIAAIATGLFQVPLTVDNRPVNATGIRAIKGDLFTTVIAGQPARGSDEIVLGAETLDRIGRSVGDSVEATGPGGSRRFRIVGRGVFPSPEDPYPLADGAALTWRGLDSLGLTDVSEVFHQTLVRWDDGVDEDAAQARLARDYEVNGPAAPPEVERLDQITALPRVLAVFLGLLAVLAVGHALVTAVHRRRRDFAVLETLGFVGRQVSGTVAWQASALAVVGLAFGIPLGLLAGRWTWTLVADGLGVATDPSVPIVALIVVAFATMLVANAIAFVPGRIAARTRPAVVLRAE